METTEEFVREQPTDEIKDYILRALEEVGVGFVVIEASLPGRSRILYASGAAKRISGYSPEELVREQSFLRFVAPDQRSILIKRLARRLTGLPVPDHYETAILHKDGRRVEVEVAVRLLRYGPRPLLVALVRDITERKRAEEEVRRQQRHLRAITDALPVLIAYIDDRQRFQFVNRAYEGWVRRPSSEMVGKTVREVVGEDIYRMIRPSLARALASEQVTTELLVSSGPGRQQVLAVTFIPDRRPDGVRGAGKVVGLFCLLLDVSGQRQVEETLRRQNAYLTTLHTTALAVTRRQDPVALLRTIIRRAGQLIGTRHGYVYLANKEGTELFSPVATGVLAPYVGWRIKSGEGIGGTVHRTGRPLLIADYDRWPGRLPSFPKGVFRAAVGVPLRIGRTVRGVIALVSTDPGRTFSREEAEILSRFADLAALALDNATLYQKVGQYAQTLRQLQSITDTALANLHREDLLDRLLERIRTIFAADLVTVYLADQATGELFEQGRRGGRRAQTPRRLPRDTDFVGTIVRTSRPGVSYHPPSTLAVHRIKTVLGVPLLAGGKVVGVLCLGTTARRQFSREEVRLLEMVGDRVALALEHARLYRELEAALRTRQEFLSIAAHELKTPVTSLKVSTQSLLRNALWSGLDPDQLTTLQILERQSDRLARLVNDLFDVTRIETGQLQLVVRRIDVMKVVRRTVERMRIFAGRRPLLVVGPRRVLLSADPDRLEQVINNLLSNAINHSPAGRPITVKVAATTSEVRLAVRDRGSGIAKKRQADIFTPLAKSAGSRSRGLGLGLFIARQIVERHGGTITVTSAPRRGSTFTVTLPRRNRGAERPPG